MPGRIPGRLMLTVKSIFQAVGILRGPVAKTRQTATGSAGQCAAGVCAIGLLTLCGIGLHWNLSTASLFFLLVVVLSAHRYGFWQASVISVAAVTAQTYCFAPPAFSFHIADAQNAVAIFVFELTALLVSRISTRERDQAFEVEQQRRSLEHMFAVSRGMLLLDLNRSPTQEMAELILTKCDIDAVAIFESENHQTGESNQLKTAGAWPWDPREAALRVSAGEDFRDVSGEVPGLSQRTLVGANAAMGSLLVLCTERRVNPLKMDSLASLVALTLERYSAFHNERSSQAARQTEQLRTTVLDGLAHAFKTPLTIIRAASSGLLEMGELSFAQQELMLLIDSESVRLDDLATRLLQTARMDDAKIELEREVVSIGVVIREVAAAATRSWDEQSDGRSETPRVQVQIEAGNEGGSEGGSEGDALCTMADYDMLTATIRELLENAAKYSTAGSPITVRASATSCEIMVSVHNRGPVIELADRERIFERFYRCPSHRYSAPGTGIGLSMARHAIEAHGGHIWVISGEHQGTTFHFALPRRIDRGTVPKQGLLAGRGI